MNGAAVLHGIAHTLRFRVADELIGRHAIVDGHRSLLPLAREMLGEPEATLIWPDSWRRLRTTLWARDGVELVLGIPSARLPAADPRANLRALQELELLGTTREERTRDREIFEDDNETMLSVLWEDTRDDHAYAMLLLTSAHEPKLPRPRKLVHHGHALLPGYFPREFVVADACEANSSVPSQ